MPPRLLKWFFPASLVPHWCLAGCPIDPFLPPWCLPSCRNGSFLPPWCLPGASQAVRCLPVKSKPVVRADPRTCHAPGRSPLKLYQKLDKIRRPSKTGIRSAFPYSESPWCLPGCSHGSFQPPWCLPGALQAVQLILSCLRSASQAVQMVLSCLPGASLVPCH